MLKCNAFPLMFRKEEFSDFLNHLALLFCFSKYLDIKLDIFVKFLQISKFYESELLA